MELMRGGELFDALVANGPYEESDASKHIRDIGSALLFGITLPEKDDASDDGYVQFVDAGDQVDGGDP